MSAREELARAYRRSLSGALRGKFLRPCLYSIQMPRLYYEHEGKPIVLIELKENGKLAMVGGAKNPSERWKDALYRILNTELGLIPQQVEATKMNDQALISHLPVPLAICKTMFYDVEIKEGVILDLLSADDEATPFGSVCRLKGRSGCMMLGFAIDPSEEAPDINSLDKHWRSPVSGYIVETCEVPSPEDPLLASKFDNRGWFYPWR